MDRELRASIGLVAVICLLVLLFIGLIRYIVPAILEAHFAGSVLVASAVGILGLLGIVALAFTFLSRFARLFKESSKGE